MVCWPSRSSSARRAARTEPPRHAGPWTLLALLAAAGGCGHADPSPGPASNEGTAASHPLCVPAGRGYLRARLQGAIDAELDWSNAAAQCRGAARPSGDGIRLLYKGSDRNAGDLVVVLGAGPLRPGESARNVPVNLTVIREGSGQFFATQGDDKCAFDEVRQEPLPSGAGQFLLTGRGFCTQPARSVGGDGSVLVSRFDLEAVVDYRQ